MSIEMVLPVVSAPAETSVKASLVSLAVDFSGEGRSESSSVRMMLLLETFSVGVSLRIRMIFWRPIFSMVNRRFKAARISSHLEI